MTLKLSPNSVMSRTETRGMIPDKKQLAPPETTPGRSAGGAGVGDNDIFLSKVLPGAATDSSLQARGHFKTKTKRPSSRGDGGTEGGERPPNQPPSHSSFIYAS